MAGKKRYLYTPTRKHLINYASTGKGPTGTMTKCGLYVGQSTYKDKLPLCGRCARA